MLKYTYCFKILLYSFSLSSVQFSHSVVSDSLRPHESQHARPPYPSPTPGVHSNLWSSSLWYHPAISSSVVPFSSCPQSLPAPESFPMSQLFAWGGQSTGISALASFLPLKHLLKFSPFSARMVRPTCVWASWLTGQHFKSWWLWSISCTKRRHPCYCQSENKQAKSMFREPSKISSELVVFMELKDKSKGRCISAIKAQQISQRTFSFFKG